MHWRDTAPSSLPQSSDELLPDVHERVAGPPDESPASLVYLKSAWVAHVASVPLGGGIEGVVLFAQRCWRQNLELQRRALEATRKLDLAESALLNQTTRYALNKDVALALVAVQSARELL